MGQENPGDGNIPAPNLFDDQIACTMNLPGAMDRLTTTVVAMGETMSPLDTAIGMGDVMLDASNTNIGDVLTNIGYVIPADGSNCGQGAAATAPTVDGMATFFGGAKDASIPMDVAAGYSALLDEFVDVYGDPRDGRQQGREGAYWTPRVPHWPWPAPTPIQLQPCSNRGRKRSTTH